MLVYRDTKRERDTGELMIELASSVRSACARSSDAEVVDALLRAGELECALADVGDPVEDAAAAVTDAVAERLLGRGLQPLHDVHMRLQRCRARARLSVKVPEGYAYYALHPRAYAELARRIAGGPRAVGVVGVRSIGTSLGAVVRAALRQHGHAAERISVRPNGPAWNRRLQLSSEHAALVRRLRGAEAHFFVVDEGPGLSGSTLLAVAEALEREGVDHGRIALLCSHPPEPEALVAQDAAARFARYACHAVAAPAARAGIDVSGGGWRCLVYGADPRRWPASRGWVERCKWCSESEGWIDKFEGLGPYAEVPLARACTLAQAGFGPKVRAIDGGFARYEWIDGRTPRAGDVDFAIIDQLARYLAFRRSAFAVDEASADPRALEDMVRVNVGDTFGHDLLESHAVHLDVRSPLVPDARMQPHEWRISAGGRLRKLDGHADGDAHLLPGPCDVCWDIAGAIVEWRMSSVARAALVARFARLSGDDVAQRLPSYLLAYCALRVGEAELLQRCATMPDGERMQRSGERYRRSLQALVEAITKVSSGRE